MERKDFINRCGTCGTLSLLGLFNIDKVAAQTDSTKRDGTNSETMNKTQIRQLLKFIDSFIDEPDKERIFNRLGIECLYSRNYDKFIAGFKDNQDEYFNRVKRGESKYWEKLEYDKAKSVITLVGRKSQTCNCEYGQCDQPPKSLCHYCCKRFQEALFGLLLGRKVRVRIDETVIFGGERCSTTIFVD
jgi:hypothetical protein